MNKRYRRKVVNMKRCENGWEDKNNKWKAFNGWNKDRRQGSYGGEYEPTIESLETTGKGRGKEEEERSEGQNDKNLGGKRI